MVLLRYAVTIFALWMTTVLAAEKPVPRVPSESDLFTYALTKASPWQSAGCEQPVKDFPRWAGFPVTRCKYTDIGVTVQTYMLNADKDKLAHWVATACVDAKARRGRKCVDTLWHEILVASSGGIFPVEGYIPEPQDGGVCYLFRDGITVWSKAKPSWQKPVDGKCGTVDESKEPLIKVWKFARIISTDRATYLAAGGTEDVKDLRWADVVRAAYQKAWNSTRNELISARAIVLAREGSF